VPDPGPGLAAEYVAIPASSAALTGRAVGLDIGGTGIKAAVVDLATGELVTVRIRELTPQPATPDAVIDVVASVFAALQETGALTPDMPAGAGFPSVMRAGRALTAVHGNVAWVGADVRELLADRTGRPFVVLNDADAAGVAELAYGAGVGQRGTVLVLDLGTGIGTALFADGQLVPNIQLGHLELRGRDAEARLSPVARKRRGIGLRQWATELSELIARYEAYLSPDLIIFGGGMTKDYPRFAAHLHSRARLVPALLGTNAGIVGAARVGSARLLDATA
jgi:polyphosphate glucokinase